MSLVDRVVSWFGNRRDQRFSGTGIALSNIGGAGRAHWAREAGNVAGNSAVSAVIWWLQRRVAEPRLRVVRPGTGPQAGTWVEIDHPLPAVFDDGPDFDSSVLLGAILIDLICYGNAYVGIQTGANSREVRGFVPLRAQDVTPRGDKYQDPVDPRLITYYEVRDTDGVSRDISPDCVVHFRWGYNPESPSVGISPVAASLREIVTDNEAATINASLLRNGGVMGLVFEPNDGAAAQVEALGPNKLDALERKMQERMTSASAGTPTIMPVSGTWRVVGYKPDELQLTESRAQAVTRILAPIGLDPMVLGLDDGSRKTYSNYAEANDAAHEDLFFPTLSIIARALTKQVLRTRYSRVPSGARVDWDLSQVRAAQPDLDALAARYGRLYIQGVVTRAEAKRALGLGVDLARDNVYADELRSGGSSAARSMQDRRALERFVSVVR
jgi:phage portal protein BeeE